MNNFLQELIVKLKKLDENVGDKYLLNIHGQMLNIVKTCIDEIYEQEWGETEGEDNDE